MKITWIGHSCFKLEKDGSSIILDPYSDGSVPGYKNVRESANIVLCSHLHGDHHGVECVKVESADNNVFAVQTIESYHDAENGTKRGLNTIHIISDGNHRIAHLGDLGCQLDDKVKNSLKNLDVLMIPVGGFYTIDARQAANLIHDINPKHVIPMHYSGKDYGYNVLDTVNVFVEQMDSSILLDSFEYDTNAELSAQIIVLRAKNLC